MRAVKREHIRRETRKNAESCVLCHMRMRALSHASREMARVTVVDALADEFANLTGSRVNDGDEAEISVAEG